MSHVLDDDLPPGLQDWDSVWASRSIPTEPQYLRNALPFEPRKVAATTHTTSVAIASQFELLKNVGGLLH